MFALIAPVMRTILIVEDSEDDLVLLKRTLKKCAIANPICTASDAAEALAFLDNRDNPCPGIIFVDLRMPGLHGLELLGKLKARPDCVDVSFFVVSSHDNLERVRQAYALGASSFVSKPMRPADLENLIQGFPRHWQRVQSSQSDT